MNEAEYGRIRDRALAELARSVVRTPPRESDEGSDRAEAALAVAGGAGAAADGGDAAAAGPGPEAAAPGDATADPRPGGESPGSGGQGPGAGDRVSVVRLRPAVRAWLDEHFDDRFADVDGIEEAVDVDPKDPEASGVDPLWDETGDEDERKRLHAYRAVRADLLAALEAHAGALATAVATHDALERLVGERGPPTDRRPREVVAAAVDWTADQRGRRAADRVAESFTVLHVMRVASLDPVGGRVPDRVREAVRAWLRTAHPDRYAAERVAIER